MTRSLSDVLLARDPARRETSFVQPTSFLVPPRVREAQAFCDVPAAAFVAGGLVYYPPPGGARIVFATMCPDTGTSRWRFGLRLISDIASSGQAGASRVISTYGLATPLAGVVEPFQFFGIGDMTGDLIEASIAYPDLLVFPPNIFIAALAADNIGAEGSIYVREHWTGEDL